MLLFSISGSCVRLTLVDLRIQVEIEGLGIGILFQIDWYLFGVKFGIANLTVSVLVAIRLSKTRFSAGIRTVVHVGALRSVTAM